nr:hypothetical protein [Tanacetum cinerariifolium]
MTPELHRQFENSPPYEMLQELKSMFEKQGGVDRFDLIQTFHACKQEKGKSVSQYVLKMKGYVEQLERLGYVLPHDLSTIGELHVMLIDYEKGLPKKAATPQVMAIHGGRIQKANKKSQNAKGKGKGKGNGRDKSYVPKPKNLSRNDVLYFNDIPSNGIYEIDMSNSVPNVNSIYNVSNKRVKHNSDTSYLWHCRLAHISKNRIGKLQHDGLLKSTDDESFDQCVSCLLGKMIRKSVPHHPERVTDLLGLIHTDEESYFVRHGSINDKSYNFAIISFWDYALEAAARILNIVPTKKVDKTPYELWFGKVPNLSYLKVWGCELFVKRDTPNKLQQRSVKCIFIGYPKETMGYYFYFPSENKIVVSRYVEFFEKNLLSQEVSGRVGDLEEIQDEDTSPFEITSEIPTEVEGFEPPHEEEAPVRRSERPHRAPNRLCLNVEVEEHSLGDLNEPTNYKAAMLNTESNKWLDAINAEIKWLFKKKTAMNGNVHTYKARLVAKGFTQTYGVDYEETFSPVADIRAIRILIAIDAFYDYEIWKIDVKTAFVNGYLDKGIYMVQPEGFIDHKHPRKVCKLQRSIYGLKKASRSWNKRFDEEIKRFGFTQNLDEPCVYQKASRSNVTFLILYVDDIIVMGNHIPSLQSVKEYLGKCFAMKDLGEAAFILGIRIYRDRSRRLIGLIQSTYMDKILKRYRMDNSKRGYILMQERLDLNKTQGASTPGEVKRMQNVPYASVNPGELHWTAVKIILKYLRNTKDMFLVYGGNPEAELRVDCYCDAGFKTNRDDTKSQTRYVFILNGGAVDWKSSKQSTTAMSAT